MFDTNVIAIDLAKASFQVCVVNSSNQIVTHKTFTRASLKSWLVKQKPSVVAIEACASSHYWGKVAQQYGHRAVLISPRFMKRFLSGHKTDKNDALAIAVAARQPGV